MATSISWAAVLAVVVTAVVSVTEEEYRAKREKELTEIAKDCKAIIATKVERLVTQGVCTEKVVRCSPLRIDGQWSLSVQCPKEGTSMPYSHESGDLFLLCDEQTAALKINYEKKLVLRASAYPFVDATCGKVKDDSKSPAMSPTVLLQLVKATASKEPSVSLPFALGILVESLGDQLNAFTTKQCSNFLKSDNSAKVTGCFEPSAPVWSKLQVECGKNSQKKLTGEAIAQAYKVSTKSTQDKKVKAALMALLCKRLRFKYWGDSSRVADQFYENRLDLVDLDTEFAGIM